MGATGTPTLIGGGGSKSSPQFLGGIHALIVPVSFTMSSSYATGGDTLTLPTSDVRGKELKAVVLLQHVDSSGRFYEWDGSATAPKIKVLADAAHSHTENTAATYTQNATTATATTTLAEVAATTDLSAVTLRALLVYAA